MAKEKWDETEHELRRRLAALSSEDAVEQTRQLQEPVAALIDDPS